MPPSDDVTDYLSALATAKTQQTDAEARRREQELAHARELAALKAAERAEEERLLKLRIQAAEAEKAAQDALRTREEKERSYERDKAEAARRAEMEEKQAQQEAAEAARRAELEEKRAKQEAAEAAERAVQKELAAKEAKRQQEQQSWMERHNCQWDETPDEYARRLTALGLVEVGRFSFVPADYDVTAGRFPLPRQIAWHQIVPQECRAPEGLLWKAPDREAARIAVAAGQMSLLATLGANGKNFTIKEFVIHVAERPHVLLDSAVERVKDSLKDILSHMLSIKPGSVKTKAGAAIIVEQPYAICRYPVTQQWYESIIGSNPSQFKSAKRPVEQVSWDDAATFCQRLTTLAHNSGLLPQHECFALPTEAQWEFACRAGSGGDFGLLKNGREGTVDQMAWYDGNSGKQTHDVGAKEPNAWDIYDMHGNVWEWCEDWYEVGRARVIRGGSWGDDASGCPAAFRCRSGPGDRYGDLGFRLSLRSI